MSRLLHSPKLMPVGLPEVYEAWSQQDVVANFGNNYRQVSNISRTKSQHLKDSHTVLWLSLESPLKPDVKSRTKM